ncbi:ABC transporter ATP-binding protein [Clostridium tepidum]|uniref:Nickel import ATP-binding protein NikD n=1 Tax=Clostridium tepidum TaxID=1962263 RepID=A0A1S9I426_9CLOT|nr:ABC transporter ATP-binding protein [Clostridium tepidum]MCR1933300.1 ABC transporter ATP-binding protein [Clostridium tepidum]MDU6877461.1 ABC transporter ATP-binding protein [Clostridium botulinum]OOO62649.1 nickel import ATP-binding protein NikD [Clostridium tepidum]OOO65087.1 nickel import ATP-binding protein NikD [Clostridium tepidum]
MNILEVKGIKIEEEKNKKNLINDMNFEIEKGKITCIVGESGSGKTMTAMSIIRMLPEGVKCTKGEIIFNGENIFNFSKEKLREFRGKRIFSIFQNSINCFNPSIIMEMQIYDMIRSHYNMDKKNFQRKIINIMKNINLKNPEVILKQYPFQLSGGMLQRMMIASAVLMEPDIIIADEPTTALDLTSQKDILNQFKMIKKELNTTILMITHDFGVVAEISDNVIIMQNGNIIEKGTVYNIFDNPKENYTKILINATFKREVTDVC